MPRGGYRASNPGGRPKGSKSKLNKAIEQGVKITGPTPLDVMLEIMNDPQADPDLRLDAAKGAAPYIHKKMPADVSVDHSGGITIQIEGYSPDLAE